MRAQDLPVLAHQQLALQEAAAELEQQRPHALRDLQSAARHDPTMQHTLTRLDGEARVAGLKASLEREKQVRQDPQHLAQRTVLLWQQLEKEQNDLRRSEDPALHARVQADLAMATDELKRDPQLESLLRNQQKQWEIPHGSHLDRVLRARTLEQALAVSAPHRGLSR
jgi:hypothetical protein